MDSVNERCILHQFHRSGLSLLHAYECAIHRGHYATGYYSFYPLLGASQTLRAYPWSNRKRNANYHSLYHLHDYRDILCHFSSALQSNE